MALDFNLDRHIGTYTGKDGFANNQALKERESHLNQIVLSLLKLNDVFAFLYTSLRAHLYRVLLMLKLHWIFWIKHLHGRSIKSKF